MQVHQIGLDQLKRRWGWFLLLGLIMVTLGTLAILCAQTTILMSQFTVIFIGWLMIIGGVLEVVGSFTVKAWGGFFIDLLTGLLYAMVGFLIVNHPVSALGALTLLIAMFLIFSGIFRMLIALLHRYQHWGWLLLSGAVNLILGLLIWRQWPSSALWVIGLFIGIDMIFYGWSLIMLSMAAKKISAQAA
jgi:uncharacterized membrane protein HdeD (DUF308 family)